MPSAQHGTFKELTEWTCISQLRIAIMKYLRRLIKKKGFGVGKMTQWVKALAARAR